jgi:cation/acetate symporter
MAGGIAAAGYGASKFLMGWTGGFVLLTTLMVPYLRKFGKATIPDFIGDRYYSDAARLVAVICAIFICMTYIMGQMRGVGIVFSRLFDIEIWMGVIIGAGIVFLLRWAWRDERNHLHPGCPVLRNGLCVHHSSVFHFPNHHR